MLYPDYLEGDFRIRVATSVGIVLRPCVGRDAMNVFLVSSPLQLLNAWEAQYAFELDPKHTFLIVIPFSYSPGDADTLLDLAGSQGWATVEALPTMGPIVAEQGPRRYAFASMWRAFRGMSRILNQLPLVERVFIGNIGARYQRHFAHQTGCREIIALDDGLATVELMERRRGGLTDQRSGRSWRRLFEMAMGAKFAPLPFLTFFTAYDVSAPPGDRVIQNEYSFVRSRMTALGSRRDELMVLGSPMRDFGLVPLETYLAYIARIRDRFASLPLLYAPHRAEREETVEAVRMRFDAEICDGGLPIEWWLLQHEQPPKYVAGFYTSALENIRVIFGSRFRVASLVIAEPSSVRADPGVEMYWEKVQVNYAYLISRESLGLEIIRC